jgi:predicted secreted acid phosphatase
MRKKYLSILFTIFLGVIVVPVYAKQPQNLTFAKRDVISYYETGEFKKDVDVVVQDAEQYLRKRVTENSVLSQPKKLAMVLDIDDTSLSNFQGNKKRDFSGLHELMEESFRDADAPAIDPVLRLYNEATKSGVSVFFITWREDEFRSYTILNLQRSGYYGWSALYMPNAEDKKLSAQVYKTHIREMLTRQGYDIILNLGDQDSDLNGGYAEHTDKIPNPLYSTSQVSVA